MTIQCHLKDNWFVMHEGNFWISLKNWSMLKFTYRVNEYSDSEWMNSSDSKISTFYNLTFFDFVCEYKCMYYYWIQSFGEQDYTFRSSLQGIDRMVVYRVFIHIFGSFASCTIGAWKGAGRIRTNVWRMLGVQPGWAIFKNTWRDSKSGQMSNPSWVWKKWLFLKINGDDDDDDTCTIDMCGKLMHA